MNIQDMCTKTRNDKTKRPKQNRRNKQNEIQILQIRHETTKTKPRASERKTEVRLSCTRDQGCFFSKLFYLLTYYFSSFRSFREVAE